uniref:Ribosomal protein L16 n=1 Tax=Synarthrophyton chejuense TaxID=2485825 RepID=A0A3G3MIJ6_9FLOR|nr:ribosomal protein L16 [Synarthrophyton chejuense]AYR06650.1 ribosomal protein L16 [Synarthrophyton chejuense]
MIKKSHKKIINNLISTCHLLRFGSIGFKTTSRGFLLKEQISSIDRVIQTKQKNLTLNSKKLKIWRLVYTNKTVTKLNLESRMGKGKGSIFTEGIFIKPGFMFYEFQNLNLNQAFELLNFINKQISINLIIVRQN